MTEVVTIGDATLYCGDCREILPALGAVDTLLTDPVWPKHGGMFGDLDAKALLSDALESADAKRVVIVMRNDQDPRFLAVPTRYPFLQACWLRYAAVGYLGRFMTGNELAYCFGEWPLSRAGRRVIPAIGPVESRPVPKGVHPCPRSPLHFGWLASVWSDGVVADPFMGSGTTIAACMRIGIPSVGIEIEPRYFDEACSRAEKAQREPPLIEARYAAPVQTVLDVA